MAISSCRRDVIVKRGTERRARSARYGRRRSLAQHTRTTFFNDVSASQVVHVFHRSTRSSSFRSARAALPPPPSPPPPVRETPWTWRRSSLEDEDDVLEDIDMSQPVDSSQDLVDSEDGPVPSPANLLKTGGVPTPGRAGAPSQANAAPPSVAAPDGNRGVSVAGCAGDGRGCGGGRGSRRCRGGGRDVSRPALPDDVPDEENLATGTRSCLWNRRRFGWPERICRRVDEPH